MRTTAVDTGLVLGFVRKMEILSVDKRDSFAFFWLVICNRVVLLIP